MNAASIFFLALASTLLAYPTQSETRKVTLQSVLSEDSDNANHSAYYLKYRHQLDKTRDRAFWGLGVGTRGFDDNAGEKNFDALTAEFQVPLSPVVSYRLSGSKLLDNHWSPWTAATALTFQPSTKSYTEVFAERDIVDTTIATARETRVNTYGFSSDYQFHREFTGVIALYRQTFDDGNTRDGRVIRALWEISRYDWIMAELKSRQLEADFNGIGYFSPEKLREDLLLVTLRNTYFNENLSLSFQFGAGAQNINNEFSQSLYVAELKAHGWLTSHIGHTTRIGCTNTGDVNFASSNDDYRYCYADIGLHYAW